MVNILSFDLIIEFNNNLYVGFGFVAFVSPFDQFDAESETGQQVKFSGYLEKFFGLVDVKKIDANQLEITLEIVNGDGLSSFEQTLKINI